MKKIISLFIKLDKWLMKMGYEMYPELTKHMKK